ncbi:uncharacterized protein (TIGR03086 family) [Haloactinopolyspora alba]|uniref:Uncharacterized protein (TIGR03086 family) n=1 Tax=Haloactinopolyspora alba TaxID=648780 RepID=A0A2P8DT97_9ACTN|nr:TIGR03086 family metal-binding protein [Haloactinopolyspora alba]PSL00425.1 uncharacterized protein (TIGR03086 family) [Haloactinopolyspora alba]
MHSDLNELVKMDERVARQTAEVVDQVRAGDLTRSTPCADWDLGELLAHMTAQHHGFAAAAAGRGEDPVAWQHPQLGDDPAATYRASVDAVVAAFAVDGLDEQLFAVPDFGPDVRLPAVQAVSAHLVDYIVHGWDVARSLDVPFEPDADAVRAALDVAEQIPDGPERREPGSPFAPAVPVSDGAAPLRRLLALLGRDPDA